jgi:hypothetical protein
MTEPSVFHSQVSSDEVIEVLLRETDIAIDTLFWYGNENLDPCEVSLLRRFAARFGFVDLCNSLEDLGQQSDCLSTRVLSHYEKAKQALRSQVDASPSA